VALPRPAANPDGSFTFTVRINKASIFWAVGWGSVSAGGVVEENFLSHAQMRLTSYGVHARSNPPEPVFGGAADAVLRENAAPGLLFECTYNPTLGTMRARYPNARIPALQQSCLLFNDIPVGAPLVPVIRFDSNPGSVGLSLTLMDL
jgi:hypothetical protein